MKITKELLEHLKLNSVSMKNNGKDTLCFLDRIENGRWTFSIPQDIKFAQNQTADFYLVFEQTDSVNKITSKIIDFGKDWLTVIPDLKTPTAQIETFLKELSEMSKRYESFGRRKEVRIKIGKEKSKLFGLSSIEQTLFLPGIKFSQPCAVLDASLHGIRIITLDTAAVKKEENFLVKLSFEKPEKTIILKAHKVYSRIDMTEQKTFVTLSCQLLEPVHYEWRERVINLIEKNKS